MSEQIRVSRRELLRDLGISAALATSGAGLVTLEAAHMCTTPWPQKKSAAKGEYKPKCFTAHEFETLRRLADLIIPADEHSQGALEAGAAEFIDFLASNSTELAEIYTGGFAWLDHQMKRRYGADFVDAKPDEQTAMLDLIAYRKNESPENAAGHPLLRLGAQHGGGRLLHQPDRGEDLGFMGNGGERVSACRKRRCSTR